MSEASQSAEQYVLPPSLIGRVDVARLLREVEAVDSELESQKVRAQEADKKPAYHLPSISQALNDFVELNALELTKEKERDVIKKQLQHLKDKAPVMHLTFPAAVDDPESLGRLVAWVRDNIHAQALVSIGLQPSLVGGVYIRTPNKVFDFSLKSVLAGKRDIIVKELGALL
jgi:F0F1-type ATP synthase delta subunit